MTTPAEIERLAREDKNEWLPPADAAAALQGLRDSIAAYVDTAGPSCHDLFDLASRPLADAGG